jgi:ABC-type Zn uptake system ZnuABC Zn-binding protein ZnuA
LNIIFDFAPRLRGWDFRPITSVLATIFPPFDFTRKIVGDNADEMLESMETSRMKIVTFMDWVSVIDEEVVEGNEGMKEEEAIESDESEYDEHVWTSPDNAKLNA